MADYRGTRTLAETRMGTFFYPHLRSPRMNNERFLLLDRIERRQNDVVLGSATEQPLFDYVIASYAIDPGDGRWRYIGLRTGYANPQQLVTACEWGDTTGSLYSSAA